MVEPLLDGPRAPDSVVPPPQHRVRGLIPFVHVANVQRSIDFYHRLGFVMASVYKYRGQPAWAALRSGGAELMVAVGDPIDQAGRACSSTSTRATWRRCAGNCSPPESTLGRSRTAHRDHGRRWSFAT
ncbi:MAG TPA: hypothetical protein VJN72_03065, partial [Gaiellales bacterium]|nr:hypothetical protein [Gaiellales bacterium]